ncbi:16S rRNA (guanine(527)-N(7))-methyltransferase RsmG [Candidatus Dependentiae bacterium]|nr:16S rRNA (guanine(527)-N(7))-methyltransferase RsmG [Candidatus Dependentiae bacterium]
MNKKIVNQKDTADELWQNFKNAFSLSQDQLDKFKKYYKLLVQNNELFNITTITELDPTIKYHFSDSLIISQFLDFTKINSIADVGTGGGFPGIPLKIMFPHLKVTLIEVIGKKISFLKEVIEELNLKDIEVNDLDWRTFLRKADFKIDLFCARASLQPEELLRIFKPSSINQDCLLVYWASKEYVIGAKEKEFFFKEETYTIGNKNRRLIFFRKAR